MKLEESVRSWQRVTVHGDRWRRTVTERTDCWRAERPMKSRLWTDLGFLLLELHPKLKEDHRRTLETGSELEESWEKHKE